MSKPFLILFFTLIASCAAITDNFFGNDFDINYFYQRFPQNKRAIIIAKFYGKEGDKKVYCRLSPSSEKIKDATDCIRITSPNLNKIMMVKPGRYMLASYNDGNDDLEFVNELNEDIPISDGLYPTSFIAAESQITYVGALLENSSYREIDDEFLEIKKILKSQNHDLILRNFNNSHKEVEWFVNQYNSSEGILIKKLAKVDYKGDKTLVLKARKYVENNIKAKDKNTFKDMEKLIDLMGKILPLEKQKLSPIINQNDQN